MVITIQRFDTVLKEWSQSNLVNEPNHRRRGMLEKGLGHGTVEFLRKVWFPTAGNLDHLYPEWEVRDFNNRYRSMFLRNCHGLKLRSFVMPVVYYALSPLLSAQPI